jgi:hypothetical protein
VLNVGERHLGRQVIRVTGVLQQSLVDLLEELTGVDVGSHRWVGR